jgi:hypothetical protein
MSCLRLWYRGAQVGRMPCLATSLRGCRYGAAQSCSHHAGFRAKQIAREDKRVRADAVCNSRVQPAALLSLRNANCARCASKAMLKRPSRFLICKRRSLWRCASPAICPPGAPEVRTPRLHLFCGKLRARTAAESPGMRRSLITGRERSASRSQSRCMSGHRTRACSSGTTSSRPRTCKRHCARSTVVMAHSDCHPDGAQPRHGAPRRRRR